MARRLHDIVASQRPRVPWTVIEPAEARVRQTTNPIRAVVMTAGALAAAALLLSVIGLAGVTAYVVSLRQREIGVRLALGGRSRDVIVMIVRQSLRLVATGIGLGLILAIPVVFLLRDGLVGASPLAVGTIAPPVFLLIGVSLLAAGVPALRAARVDPIEVLRQD
jgi:ABC-type antimicrobial peptide transport system permease subunit